MITDTAFFRNPHYHEPTDMRATLDYGRLARVTAGLERMLEEPVGLRLSFLIKMKNLKKKKKKKKKITLSTAPHNRVRR